MEADRTVQTVLGQKRERGETEYFDFCEVYSMGLSKLDQTSEMLVLVTSLFLISLTMWRPRKLEF
jgi:hypothetical protein